MPGLGTLTVYLNANSTGLERGISKAMGMLKTMAATAAAFAGVNAIKNLVSESLNLMSVQEQSERALTRALATSNKQINGSAGQLKQWAADMQRLTTFGDEKLIQAQTRLIEMNAVQGKAFDAARSAALDIAAARGEDVTQVMQKLGKAMLDPIAGFRTLKEYGVDPAIREEVEKRIAAGDKEAAQLVILTDLQKRFAGAAEDAADTYAGRLSQIVNAFGDLKEGIGYVLMEIMGGTDGMKSVADFIGNWANELRLRAREIGFAFRSVWIDIMTGANKLWLHVSPLMDQIMAVVSAAITNIKELVAGTFNFVEPNYSIYSKEMAELGKKLSEVEAERNRAQDELVKDLVQREEKARQQDAAKSAARTEKAVERGVVAASKTINQNAVSAQYGSSEAWKIITAAAAVTRSTKTGSGSVSYSVPVIPATPAIAARMPKPDTSFHFITPTPRPLTQKPTVHAWMDYLVDKPNEALGNAITSTPGDPMSFSTPVNPAQNIPFSDDSVLGKLADWLGSLFGVEKESTIQLKNMNSTMQRIERNTSAAIPKPANLQP